MIEKTFWPGVTSCLAPVVWLYQRTSNRIERAPLHSRKKKKKKKKRRQQKQPEKRQGEEGGGWHSRGCSGYTRTSSNRTTPVLVLPPTCSHPSWRQPHRDYGSAVYFFFLVPPSWLTLCRRKKQKANDYHGSTRTSRKFNRPGKWTHRSFQLRKVYSLYIYNIT